MNYSFMSADSAHDCSCDKGISEVFYIDTTLTRVYGNVS